MVGVRLKYFQSSTYDEIKTPTTLCLPDDRFARAKALAACKIRQHFNPMPIQMAEDFC